MANSKKTSKAVESAPAEPAAAAAIPAVAAPPATAKAAASVAKPAARRPAARSKAVDAKVQATQAALSEALDKATAVKITKPLGQPAKKAEAAAKPAAKPAKPAKAPKPRKAKLVRDSFTMPEDEYAQLPALKKRLATNGVEVKKSELLRAGVALLAALKDAELTAALAKVEKIKTGRPAKAGK